MLTERALLEKVVEPIEQCRCTCDDWLINSAFFLVAAISVRRKGPLPAQRAPATSHDGRQHRLLHSPLRRRATRRTAPLVTDGRLVLCWPSNVVVVVVATKAAVLQYGFRSGTIPISLDWRPTTRLSDDVGVPQE